MKNLLNQQCQISRFKWGNISKETEALSLNSLPHLFQKIISVNQDYNLHRIIFGLDKYFWLASIYPSKGSLSQILLLFKKNYLHIPPEEWKFFILAETLMLTFKNQVKNLNYLLLYIYISVQFYFANLFIEING